MSTPNPGASLAAVALKGRCPRCGVGNLFDGYLRVAEKCNRCGLSFAGHDTGDGPAFFIMLPLCLIVAALALFTEIFIAPPLWVHMTVWPLFICVFVALTLRPVKAIMVALQYRHRDVEHYEQ
jgi:uncharacterized protein (DUF983 family)